MHLSLSRIVVAFIAMLTVGSTAAFEMPVVTPLADGLKNPESVAVGDAAVNGRTVFTIVVSEIGEFDKDGDGRVTIIDGAKKKPLAEGLDDPKGIVFVGEQLFVADKNRIWKIDKQGKASVFVKAEDFPQPPLFLNDLVADGSGNLYVSDSGDIEKGAKGAIFKITPSGKVSLVMSEAQNASIKSPNGLLVERPGTLLVVDFASGELLRLNMGIAPTAGVGKGNRMGVLGGDNAGFPNGRRPGDDVVDIELRVAMGVLCVAFPNVYCAPSDAPSGSLPFTDGALNDVSQFDTTFPYLTDPFPGSPNGPRAATIQEHTHHAANSPGSQCVSCHMPKIEQTMANVNVRSHTFEVIGPHVTDEFKMPNSCTACHTDKSTEWIRTAMRSWPNVSPWRVQ